MPPFGPIPRKRLVANLRRLGFDGPYSGGRHQFMKRDDVTVFIPNPHQGGIGRNLLARILKQVKVSRDQWDAL